MVGNYVVHADLYHLAQQCSNPPNFFLSSTLTSNKTGASHPNVMETIMARPILSVSSSHAMVTPVEAHPAFTHWSLPSHPASNRVRMLPLSLLYLGTCLLILERLRWWKKVLYACWSLASLGKWDLQVVGAYSFVKSCSSINIGLYRLLVLFTKGKSLRLGASTNDTFVCME